MNPLQLLISQLHENAMWEEEQTLERNAFLTVEGKTDTNLYWIEEGSLRVFTISEHEEHTIRLGYQNNLITALDSFITGQPTKMYIQAIRKCKLLSISKKKFTEFIDRSDAYRSLWNNMLEGFIIEQMEREQDILINSPVERYKRVFARSPQLFQEIPLKYIASYLRMSPETLSRIKKS